MALFLFTGGCTAEKVLGKVYTIVTKCAAVSLKADVMVINIKAKTTQCGGKKINVYPSAASQFLATSSTTSTSYSCCCA